MQYELKCQALFYVKYIASYPYENCQQPVWERVNGAYQIVDAQKEEVFFPELLITLRSYVFPFHNIHWCL